MSYVNIFEREGVIILEGVQYDLKIDNNRDVYIKFPNAKKFTYLDDKIEKGFTVEEKKKILYELYLTINESLKEDSKNTK